MLRVVLLEPLAGPWRLRRYLVDHSQVRIDQGSIGAIVEERTHGHPGDNGHDAEQDASAPAFEKALRFFGHMGIHQSCADPFGFESIEDAEADARGARVTSSR